MQTKLEEVKDKEEELVVTVEEQELIFKGIRPKGMRQDVFKHIRKNMNTSRKLYLGGKFIQLAVGGDSELLKDSSIGKGTFVRRGKKLIGKAAIKARNSKRNTN